MKMRSRSLRAAAGQKETFGMEEWEEGEGEEGEGERGGGGRERRGREREEGEEGKVECSVFLGVCLHYFLCVYSSNILQKGKTSSPGWHSKAFTT